MGQPGRTLFSEAQPLRQWHARVVLAFPPAALVFIACRQILWHKPWGSPPLSNGGLVFLTVFLLAVYFRLITVKLVTELRADEIDVGLRGLWKRRRIPLAAVRSVKAVTFDPVAEFGGYGIRSGRGATAYIASGNRAVELLLEGGRKVLIGSQDPELLAARIRDRQVQESI
jgi:hypothetical protein